MIMVLLHNKLGESCNFFRQDLINCCLYSESENTVRISAVEIIEYKIISHKIIGGNCLPNSYWNA